MHSVRNGVIDNAVPRDPRCRVLLALCCLLAVVFAQRVVFPLEVAFGVLVWALVKGWPFGTIAKRLSLPLGFVAVMSVVSGLLVGSTPLCQVRIWAGTLTLYEEGLQHAGLIATRVLGAATILMWLAATVPTYRLFAALRALRVPKDWLEMAIGVYAQLRDLSNAAREIAVSQRLRLGYRGWRRSFSSAQVLAGLVLVRALNTAERRSEAMQLRAYDGALAVEQLPALSLAQRAYLVAGSVAIVAIAQAMEHLPW